jgi:hypothetical protein
VLVGVAVLVLVVVEASSVGTTVVGTTVVGKTAVDSVATGSEVVDGLAVEGAAEVLAAPGTRIVASGDAVVHAPSSNAAVTDRALSEERCRVYDTASDRRTRTDPGGVARPRLPRCS